MLFQSKRTLIHCFSSLLFSGTIKNSNSCQTNFVFFFNCSSTFAPLKLFLQLFLLFKTALKTALAPLKLFLQLFLLLKTALFTALKTLFTAIKPQQRKLRKTFRPKIFCKIWGYIQNWEEFEVQENYELSYSCFITSFESVSSQLVLRFFVILITHKTISIQSRKGSTGILKKNQVSDTNTKNGFKFFFTKFFQNVWLRTALLKKCPAF